MILGAISETCFRKCRLIYSVKNRTCVEGLFWRRVWIMFKNKRSEEMFGNSVWEQVLNLLFEKQNDYVFICCFEKLVRALFRKANVGTCVWKYFDKVLETCFDLRFGNLSWKHVWKHDSLNKKVVWNHDLRWKTCLGK